tara:strand:- start:201 stop:401 length:201 start_codon:yes stop_codon:yes gene_type:complete
MPLTLPTVYALRFVKNNNLKQRISILQNSYKTQIISFFSIGAINVKDYFIAYDLNIFTSQFLFLLY